MQYKKEIPFSHLNLFEHYAQDQDAAHYVNDEDALERLLQCSYADGLIAGASANLTEKQRRVTTLRKQGKKFREIGEILGINKVTAIQYYQASIKKLQKITTFSPISEGK